MGENPTLPQTLQVRSDCGAFLTGHSVNDVKAIFYRKRRPVRPAEPVHEYISVEHGFPPCPPGTKKKKKSIYYIYLIAYKL